jgi:exopolysaccharide biosynthesis polyprenyl glycosylphosphotransferase
MPLVDVAVVVLAMLAAYWVRFVLAANEEVALGLDQYIRLGLIVGVLASALFAVHGLYDLDRPRAWPARLNALVSGLSTSVVLTIGASYFLGDQPFSRLWLALGWLLASAALIATRTLAQHAFARLREVAAPLQRVLIVGANALGEQLACEMADRYQVVGCIDNGSDLERGGVLPLLGPITQLEQLVQAYAVDEIVIALPANRREQVSRIIAAGFGRHVKVKFLAGLDDMLPQQLEFHDFGGRRFIGFAPVASVSWLKRALDVGVSAAALIALAPVLAAIAVLIKADSAGGVFYRQQRVGKNGRHFGMLKFRSMGQDADCRLAELRARNEASGPLFKMRQDPRITCVGSFLRRWSLDELPQLLNVLRGEMSLVGPRPPLPSEVEQYEDWQLGRLRAVPGVTGLWQVSGRSEVPFHDMVRLDLHYIRNWSLGLDVEILLRTIPAVLTSRGAY